MPISPRRRPPATRSGPCSRYFGERSSTDFPNPYKPAAPLPWIPCGYQPRQIMSAYGIDALHRVGLDGRGQTIAITGAFFSPTLRDDANRFSREFGLPRLDRRSYREVVAPGTLKYPRHDEETQSWYMEQALDVEWAHAVAPRARLVYVGAANDAGGLDHAINTAIDDHLANIISNSWGLPEAYASKGEVNSLNDMFKQAAAEGIGVYFASGDDGDLKDAIGDEVGRLPRLEPMGDLGRRHRARDRPLRPAPVGDRAGARPRATGTARRGSRRRRATSSADRAAARATSSPSRGTSRASCPTRWRAGTACCAARSPTSRWTPIRTRR